MFSIPEFRRYLSNLLHPVQTISEENQWSQFAQSLPSAPFIVWLANQVATDLISQKPNSLSIDNLIAGVDDDTAGCMQHEAERFLERHLGLFRYDPRLHRIIVVFRHVIQHRLRHRVCNQ